MAEKFLRDANISYTKIYADENPELAKEYAIMQAPTLVVVSGNSTQKIVNVSNIRKFAESAVLA